MAFIQTRLTSVLFCALALAPAAPAGAKPPTAPGSYAEWNGDLDHVDIIQAFHLKDYTRVLVLPIDVTSGALPTNSGNAATERVLAKTTPYFADQLDSNLPNRMKVKVQAVPANTGLDSNPGNIILRAKLVEMNAGSEVGRVASLGFSGATHITMEGEFIDGGTGRTLLRFTQHNQHFKGGIFHKSTAALEENEDQIAESVAKLIKAFYP